MNDLDVDPQLDARLRDTLQRIAASVHPDDPADGAFERSTTRRRPLAYAGAAATLVALGVGLIVATTGERAPTTTAVVIDEPRSIDLDRWIDDDRVFTACPCPVFDVEQLSSGWRVEAIEGGFVSPLSSTEYVWSAHLRNRLGTEYDVAVASASPPTPAVPDGDRVEIASGVTGLVGDRALAWMPSPSVHASIVAAPSEFDVAEAIELAGELSLREVDQLPGKPLPEPTGPLRMPSDAELAGTIAGREWQIDVGETSLLDMNLAVDGRGVAASSRDPATTVTSTTHELAIGAVPGGVVLYGATPPVTDRVVVDVNGVDVVLPVHRRADATVYAIPVPSGVHVGRVDFLDDGGQRLHRLLLPPLPTPTVGGGGITSRSFGNPAGERLGE